jgi:hypothetical protein
MTKGSTREKFEGLCVTAQGDIWVNNDNDGLNDNSGENVLAIAGTISLPGDDGSAPVDGATESPATSPADAPVDGPVGTPTGSSATSAIFMLPAALFAVAAIAF